MNSNLCQPWEEVLSTPALPGLQSVAEGTENASNVAQFHFQDIGQDCSFICTCWDNSPRKDHKHAKLWRKAQGICPLSVSILAGGNQYVFFRKTDKVDGLLSARLHPSFCNYSRTF